MDPNPNKDTVRISWASRYPEFPRSWVLSATLMAFAGLIGLILLFFYSLTEQTIRVFLIGTLAAFAAGAVGSIAGFLFGLPRYQTPLSVDRFASNNHEDDPSAVVTRLRAASGNFIPSNNLVQVSDWLTKLLLGAGLVQLGAVGRWLGALIDSLAVALTADEVNPAPPYAQIIAGSAVIFYAVLGFLFTFVSTFQVLLHELRADAERLDRHHKQHDQHR